MLNLAFDKLNLDAFLTNQALQLFWRSILRFDLTVNRSMVDMVLLVVEDFTG
jgi:hypothetical protein